MTFEYKTDILTYLSFCPCSCSFSRNCHMSLNMFITIIVNIWYEYYHSKFYLITKAVFFDSAFISAHLFVVYFDGITLVSSKDLKSKLINNLLKFFRGKPQVLYLLHLLGFKYISVESFVSVNCWNTFFDSNNSHWESLLARIQWTRATSKATNFPVFSPYLYLVNFFFKFLSLVSVNLVIYKCECYSIPNVINLDLYFM